MQKLKSEKTRVHDQFPQLKMPFKNSISENILVKMAHEASDKRFSAPIKGMAGDAKRSQKAILYCIFAEALVSTSGKSN
jgi:hypothetical protein